MALFTPIIGAVAFGWRRPTTARVFPPLTKLEDTFSKLLDINDVLILQPIRYIFNEVGFET